MEYTIYILNCVGNRFYSGITTDLERRFIEHMNGINCKFTRAFSPTHVAAAWQLSADRGCAQQIEHHIKKQSKAIKQQWVDNPNRLKKSLIDADIISAEIKLAPITLHQK